MSTANKIFTNTIWQVSIRIVNILIGVFSLALITRILGQSGFGFYTTIFAFVQVFAILADLGLYMALLREISASHNSSSENRSINNIFTIRLLASLLVLLVIPLAVKFFPYDQTVKQGVVLFMGVFFFQSLVTTLSAVFAKKLDMAKVALADLAQKIFYLAVLVYLYFNQPSLNGVLFTASLSMFFSFLTILYFLKAHTKLALAFDFVYWKKIFYTTWPLAVTVVLNLLYFKTDTLILSAYSSPEEVGIYGAPYRVLEVIATFPHMFMSLILPIFTAKWIANKVGELNKVLQYNFDFFSVLSVLMIYVTWIISTPLMIKLAGEDFVNSGPILNVLILATVAIFFGTLFIYLIVAMSAQKQMIKYFLTAAVLALTGYFIFIPKYSYWGAAYMTLFVEWLIVFFAYRVVKKNIAIKLKIRSLVLSVVAGFISFGLAYILKDFNIIIALLFSLIVYSALIFILKVVTKEQLKNIFSKEV